MLGFESNKSAGSEAKGIYVSMDALFDLRLGAVMLIDNHLQAKGINSRVAIELSMQESYYTRVNDEFSHAALGSLSRDKLYSLIKAKPDEVLRLSPATPAVQLIAALVLCIRAKSLAGDPKCTDAKVVIDTHGFNLSQDEKDALVRCVDAKLDVEVDIELVDIGPDRLDAGMLAKHYYCVLMYNYTDWLDAQVNSLQSLKAKAVECYFPRVHFKSDPAEQELKEIENYGTDFYRAYTELFLGPFVLAQLTPIALYSAHTLLNKAELYAPDLNHRNETSEYGVLPWRQKFRLPESGQEWLSFKNMSAQDLPKTRSFEVKPPAANQ